MKLIDQTSVELQSSAIEPAKTMLNDSILSRVSREYSASIARRKICEYVQPTALRRHMIVDYEGEDFLMCSWGFLMECLKINAGDYVHFASACFPEFVAMNLDDQRLMLKNFATRLYEVETHCRTFRKFGSLDGPIYMGTLTTYQDSRNFKFFIEEESPDFFEDIAKSMNHYTDRIRSLVGPILMSSQFTDTEYDAIYALAVWQIDPNQDLPECMVSMCESVRLRLFDALKEYYREELGLDDYSVRLGNMITFEHTIQESMSLLAEEMVAYNLTGLLDSDASFLRTVSQFPL
ncbi:hypothetical protein PENTCL1PPCAC_16859 [Pristionchus entomophagus]|uniref:NR LBD domain-containing protein n=1 Tax=Pristionchus entomophagus TaxID=358040 RepID=A0AAV5TK36_9BILA|nr:hypothetical protein PENTCL1PPCAC_16859 [Pristionchus entomophagus]